MMLYSIDMFLFTDFFAFMCLISLNSLLRNLQITNVLLLCFILIYSYYLSQRHWWIFTPMQHFQLQVVLNNIARKVCVIHKNLKWLKTVDYYFIRLQLSFLIHFNRKSMQGLWFTSLNINVKCQTISLRVKFPLFKAAASCVFKRGPIKYLH